MRLALAQSERRYGGARVEDDGLMDRLLLAKNDPPKPIFPAASPAVDRSDDPPRVDAPTVLPFIPMADFWQFVDFLRFEIYKHYGKSGRDESLTIEQLREKGRSVEKAKRGISGETLNPHLTFLGQIFDYAIARGMDRFRIKERPSGLRGL